MINKNKRYRTRDGREVRIYAVDGGGSRPVHGAIREGDIWLSTSWLPSGEGGLDCNSLFEVRPRIKQEVWVNVYRGRESQYFEIYDEYDDALEHHTKDTCIACVKLTIDCEEGEGL